MQKSSWTSNRIETMPVPWLAESDTSFPPPERALETPNGLLAAGGDLSAARLLTAYANGIFPWYEEGQPILWWSPDPRLILDPRKIHLSRSLRRDWRRHPPRLTMDSAFSAVVRACAEPRGSNQGTWITAAMHDAYLELHQLGFAHSVEVWHDDVLTGGVYGIALGKAFFGESMFSRRTNASKIALAALCHQLQEWDYELLDCQVVSTHLMSLGATVVSRELFLAMLAAAVARPGHTGRWQLTVNPEQVLHAV